MCFPTDPLFRATDSESPCCSSSTSSSVLLSRFYSPPADGEKATLPGWHSFIVLLSLPHVCLSFPLSFHLSVRGTITLSVLSSSQSGWVMLPPIFSFTASLSRSLSHPLLLVLSPSLSLTHTRCCLCPPHLPSYLLPVSSPSPHLSFCSLSHLALYMFMHSRMLHSYTLMHTLQWDMG